MGIERMTFGKKSGVILSIAYSIILLFSWIAPLDVFANVNLPIKLKVAVLDNLLNEKLSSDNYINFYILGLKSAKLSSIEKGINIEYKTFFYDSSPLAIFKMVPQVNNWHPDLIIGPRDSYNFLLLKNEFNNILVISPYATASEVTTMPSNFYSMSRPDKYSAEAILDLVESKFPNKGVFCVIEADCKSCVDVGKIFIQKYKKIHPNESIITSNFLNEDANILDIKKLMKGYKKNQIVLLPDQSVSSGILMMRITNYLKQDNTVFIGGDGWGSWKSGAPGKFQSVKNYIGYRVVPWSLDVPDAEFNQFNEFFYRTFHFSPPDHITYIIYRTLNSVVAALEKYPAPKPDNMQQQVLYSYRLAIKNDPNWFRPNKFAIYSVNTQGEKYFGTTDNI